MKSQFLGSKHDSENCEQAKKKWAMRLSRKQTRHYTHFITSITQFSNNLGSSPQFNHLETSWKNLDSVGNTYELARNLKVQNTKL